MDPTNGRDRLRPVPGLLRQVRPIPVAAPRRVRAGRHRHIVPVGEREGVPRIARPFAPVLRDRGDAGNDNDRDRAHGQRGGKHGPERDAGNSRRGDSGAGDEVRSPATRPEVTPVSPRRELRAQRRADPEKLEPVSELGEPDILGRDSHIGVAERPLGDG